MSVFPPFETPGSGPLQPLLRPFSLVHMTRLFALVALLGILPTPAQAVAAYDNLYPASALDRHEQGTVLADIIVSAQGAVTDCTVLVSSTSSILDTGTCIFIKARQRFAPFRDESGNPIEVHGRFKLKWVIPGCSAPKQTDERLREPVLRAFTITSVQHC